MPDFKIYLTGDAVVQRMFMELPQNAQERVVRPLVEKASKTIAELIRSEAPQQSGLLRAAIGASSLRKYGGGTLFVAAGVRRGFRRAVAEKARGGLKFMSQKATEANPGSPVQNPTKYLHLVIGGRKAISARNRRVLYDARTGRFFGRQVAAVQPNPFMDRAFVKAQQDVSQQFIAEAEGRIVAEAQALLRG
jgi:hypothetical protein